jgi:hypothetical protein
MRFLHNKIVLTKDNLAKRNWNGCQKCCFCDEPMEHLFLDCPFAKIVWSMIYFAYNISAPINITNMFDNRLNGVSKNDKARIQIGISALCWSIWTCRNDMVLNKQKATKFFQVIELHTGFSYGHSYSRRIGGRIWF